MKKVLGNKWYIFLLSAPALILLAAFVVYPIFNIVVMSLQKTNGLTPPEWIGLENFKTLFNGQEHGGQHIAHLDPLPPQPQHIDGDADDQRAPRGGHLRDHRLRQIRPQPPRQQGQGI